MSTAGLRMSPASPPVQHTSTVCTPSSWYARHRSRSPSTLRRRGARARVSTHSGLPSWSTGGHRDARRSPTAARYRRDRRASLRVRVRCLAASPSSRSWPSLSCTSRPSTARDRHASRRRAAPRADGSTGSAAAAASSARPSTCPVDYAAARRRAGRRSRSSARPAETRTQRIGSLVVNFGGPGDPGTETLRAGDADASRRDPRPVRHRELRPPRHGRLAADRLRRRRRRSNACWSEDPTPTRHDELPELLRRHRQLGRPRRRVHRRATATGSRDVGTRNVARDLDRIRAALGRARAHLPRATRTAPCIGAVYAQDVPGPGPGDGARLGRQPLDDRRASS